MTDKELVGEKVVSTMYGEGEIINVFPEKVEIRFPVKITQFIWVAFSKTLRAVRENVQEYILAKLNFIITFSLGGHGAGEVPKEIKCVSGEVIKLPEEPQGMQNYTFLGWDDGLQTYPAGADFVVKGNVSFTAQWKCAEPPRPASHRRIYFVFQGKTSERMLFEGFIFAPYSPMDRYFHYWERMSEVRKGDIILHCSNGEIVAVSEALGSEYRISMPRWAGAWYQYGPYARAIDIDAHQVMFPVVTRKYREKIKEYCRNVTNSPFNINGTGNQGYLYNCPKRLAHMFLSLLVGRNRELEGVGFIKDIFEQMRASSEYDFTL